MSTTGPLSNFTDNELVAEIKRLAAAERRATAALIRALMEVDARKLYLRESCSSLFTYCTQVLHLAEGSAYNRIEVARAARRYPAVLDALEEGSVTLTAARLLAPHLTPENHRGVLDAARHKSKPEVERLIASLNPQPDAPAVIRKLPMCAAVTPIAKVQPRNKVPIVPAAPAAPEPRCGSAPPPTRPVLAPLAPERFKLQVTISRATHDKLRRLQDLLRHAIPSGDPAEILDRAFTLLLADVERQRCAATSAPRPPREATRGSRHIPACVKRAVWARDDGRCAFAGPNGRCTEHAFLEFHHVEPYAAGGAASVDNIQLRCRAHNAYEASLFFGEQIPGLVRERSPAWPLVPEQVAAPNLYNVS